MKTILLTTAIFLVTGALGGYIYEAIVSRQAHAQGGMRSLTDFTFEAIFAMVFGVIGCFVGLIVGTGLYWFKRRLTLKPTAHCLPTPWTRILTV